MAWGNRILVCGFYGYHNLGDEAMLRGLRRWLQRCGCDFPLTVYSKDPEDTRARHGVRVLDNRYAPRRRAQLAQWARHWAAIATHPEWNIDIGPDGPRWRPTPPEHSSDQPPEPEPDVSTVLHRVKNAIATQSPITPQLRADADRYRIDIPQLQAEWELAASPPPGAAADDLRQAG